MDFITLEQTLEAIAGRVKASEEIAEHTDLVEAWKYSEAGATLHQLLHNLPELAPRWMIPHKVTGKAIFNDAVAAEGLEMLEYLSGWFKRQCLFRGNNHRIPSESKEEFEADLAKTAYYRKYKWGAWWRSHDIGFNRADVVRFLVAGHVAFSNRLGDDQSGQRSLRLTHEQRDAKPENTRAAGELPDETQRQKSPTTRRVAPKLALPDKSDPWAKAIEATYELMVREHGGTPSGLEVWLRMNDQPPANYPIKVTKDRGLAAIAMPGEKLLTRDGFTKRWQRYTTAT